MQVVAGVLIIQVVLITLMLDQVVAVMVLYLLLKVVMQVLMDLEEVAEVLLTKILVSIQNQKAVMVVKVS